MKGASGMKLRIRYKAKDANVKLYDVPFDSKQFNTLVDAFRTLGNDTELQNMITLKERTNTTITFDIAGSDTVLEPFFEKYYSRISWSQVLKEFSGRPKASVKAVESEDNVKEAVSTLRRLFKQEGIDVGDIKYRPPVIKGDDGSFLIESIDNRDVVAMTKLGRRLSSILAPHGFKYITMDKSKNNMVLIVSNVGKKKQ